MGVIATADDRRRIGADERAQRGPLQDGEPLPSRRRVLP
jgi:hypothetical protein